MKSKFLVAALLLGLLSGCVVVPEQYGYAAPPASPLFVPGGYAAVSAPPVAQLGLVISNSSRPHPRPAAWHEGPHVGQPVHDAVRRTHTHG